MTLFISYCRRDGDAVRLLHGDLERAKRDAWFDGELDGGQRWWDEILGRIRASDVFVFVLSPDSVRSRACLAELDYAVRCGRAVLPVLVRDVDIDRAPEVVGMTNVVDLRQRSPESVIALLNALDGMAPAAPLPAVLPAAPPPPILDLEPVRARLAAAELAYHDQLDVVNDLRDRVDDPDQQPVVLALLQQLRTRSDLAASVAAQIDAVVARAPVLDGEASTTLRRVRANEDAARRQMRGLVQTFGRSKGTPILGFGLTDSLIGSRRTLARGWARSFEFPFAEHEQDLPHVAQFVAVTMQVEVLRQTMHDAVVEHLRRTYDDLPGHELGEVLRQAWRRHRGDGHADPHTVLAQLPCPIYVSAQPFDLLAEALREAGREPVVDICRWRPGVYDWPESVFDVEPDYRPTPERPLVYHVFGSLSFPDSVVLTEDDHLDFLAAVSNPQKSLIPSCVQSALADSALLLLGFALEDWDVRLLLRALIGQPCSEKLGRYQHVAAQLDVAPDAISPAAAQDYLEAYFGSFGNAKIQIFWGSVDEFADALDRAWNTR